MTTDRDFKKLVRSRMRRTGESYSTARSRIRAKRAETSPSVDTSSWRMLELGEIRLRVPDSWIDLGTTDSFEVAHLGPARNVFSGAAALFATDDGPDWLHALAHPFGGLRVFRQDVGDNGLSAADARALHATSLRLGGYHGFDEYDTPGHAPPASGFVCSRQDRLRRSWTLRHHYVEAPDRPLVLLVFGTFAYGRDEGLIEAVLESVAS